MSHIRQTRNLGSRSIATRLTTRRGFYDGAFGRELAGKNGTQPPAQNDLYAETKKPCQDFESPNQATR